MQKSTHPVEPAEIMAYLDGELPPDRAARAAAHLQDCAECQALAADIGAVAQSLQAWQVEESTARCPEAAAPRRSWRVRPWVWGLAAAGLVLAVVAVPIRRQVMGSRAGPALEFAPVEHFIEVPPPKAPAATVAPMIARTAELTLTTREFDRVRPGVEAILQRHRGYLGSLNVAAPAAAPRTLNATLRVPAAELPAALDELKKLGRVESEQQGGEDVGGQYVDLMARLANARNTESRLTGILRERTGKLADVLDVEKELDRVRGEIERMEAEKKALSTRVDFATVSLTISETRADAGTIGGAAREGWISMTASARSAAVFAAANGPTVLLWCALLFLPVRWAWRRWRPAATSRL